MDDDLEKRFGTLRPGDRVEVEELSDLADTVVELRRVIRWLHDQQVHIFETSTGRRSDTAEIGDMIFDALDNVRKGPPAEVSRENGKKGGRPKKPRGMADSEAELYWHSNKYESNQEAVDAMNAKIKRIGGKPETYWTVNAAWRAFGGSNRKTGPRGPRDESK